MPRLVSDPAKYAEAITGSFNIRLIVDIFYGPERVRKDLPLADSWQLKWDLEAAIKGSGTLLVQYSGDMADSLTPYEFSDLLAPFGAEANVLIEVTAGAAFKETLLLGRYQIKVVPSARDEHMRVMDRDLVVGSVLELTLQDNLERIKRWGFDVERQPETASAWDEIARITGFQITRSLPDASVPEGMIYEPKKGGRLDAVTTLAGLIGGSPYMTPDNTLSVMPTMWDESDVTVKLKLGSRGTILDAQHSMTSEDVVNEVYGTFENTDDATRTPLHKVARIEAGRLSVDGPYGPNTAYMTASGSYTDESAQAAVDAELQRLVTANTYRVPVTAIADPSVMIGDIASVEQPGRTVVGRVMSMTLSGSGLMQCELEVYRRVV